MLLIHNTYNSIPVRPEPFPVRPRLPPPPCPGPPVRARIAAPAVGAIGAGWRQAGRRGAEGHHLHRKLCLQRVSTEIIRNSPTDSTTQLVPKESAISITPELLKECALHLIYQFRHNYFRTTLYEK